MSQNNKIIEEYYKIYKKKLNKDYYKENRKVVLRKALLQRICRMQGKMSSKTLHKYKITVEEVDEICKVVKELVEKKEIQILQYDIDDPKTVNHSLLFVEAYYNAIKRRITARIDI